VDNLIIIFIPIVIVGLALTFSKGKVAEFLSKSTTIFTALILWTLFGFIFVLDNSMAWGCLIGIDETFSFENIIYSGLSVLFITIGFFSPDRKGLIILLGELLYWTIKLMTAKGGYAIGLGGTPDEVIVMFDSVALTLRLLLIQSRIDFVLTKKVYMMVTVSFIIMTLKMLFLR
jgi:hypothetical protein